MNKINAETIHRSLMISNILMMKSKAGELGVLASELTNLSTEELETLQDATIQQYNAYIAQNKGSHEEMENKRRTIMGAADVHGHALGV